MINYIQRKRNKKGFTLIELVVVIAILGILAALAIPRFTGTRESANTQTVISNLRSIESAIELYAARENIDLENAEIKASIDKDKVEDVMGNWPEGPGKAQYTVIGGEPAVYLAGLAVEEGKFKSAGVNYYYTAN